MLPSGSTCSGTTSTAATASWSCNGNGSLQAYASSPSGYKCLTQALSTKIYPDPGSQCQSNASDLGLVMVGSSVSGSTYIPCTGRAARCRARRPMRRRRTTAAPNGGTLSGTNCIGAAGDAPASTTKYIYLAGKAIAEDDSAEGVVYTHADALGSPVARSNASATVLSRTRFEPYGNVASGFEPTRPNSIGFTGHVNDANTGLTYMQQRYYDPIAGRFMSVDPVVTDTATGKQFGLYTYADNNPYAKVDPDGRAPFAVLVKLLDNGGKVFLQALDKAGAVMARRAGENVQAATKSNAKQIEIASRNGRTNEILQHSGHELKDGSVGDPHFQTDGVSGHTFWGEMGGALPELLEGLLTPIWATPTTLGVDSFYGAGTPYKNREEYERAQGTAKQGTAAGDGGKSESSESAGVNGSGGGFQGVYEVSGRIDSKKLDDELKSSSSK